MVFIAIVKKRKCKETMSKLKTWGGGEFSNIPSAGNVTGAVCEQIYLG